MRDADPLRLPVHYDARAGILPAWDPTGTLLAVVAREGLVVLDVRAPEARVLGGPRFCPRSVAWSPDGDTLAVAYGDRDLQRLLRVADGVLATACRDGVVRRLPRSDGDLEAWARLDAEYGGLTWAPDGAHLAVCCTDSVFILPVDGS